MGLRFYCASLLKQREAGTNRKKFLDKTRARLMPVTGFKATMKPPSVDQSCYQSRYSSNHVYKNLNISTFLAQNLFPLGEINTGRTLDVAQRPEVWGQ